MWQLTHPVGVDGGSKQRLGQGDIAQHRMQEEGRGGRVAAHDGVCNRILKQRATFWVKLVCGVCNRTLQHAVQHSGSCLCVEYAIASCNMQCNILGHACVWSMQLHPATQCNILGQACVWSMQSYPARCSATFTVKLVCGVCNCILQHSATFWVKLACKCFGSRASCSIAYRSVH